ncbi:hypothetical protein [Stenotrophomonas cyclobalanopsidis]|uniref:hypothetical protein n=1 Tax=Stenotrophomonas cyclobalanopsidis TaxID=2771362 RepID=UPI0034600E5F
MADASWLRLLWVEIAAKRIHADFPDVGQDRAYSVIPINAVKDQHLRSCLLQEGDGALDAFFRSAFLERHGVVLEGDPESWSSMGLRFVPRCDAYAAFVHRSSLEVLASAGARMEVR